jgi:SAM-dependent methyltransferase
MKEKGSGPFSALAASPVFRKRVLTPFLAVALAGPALAQDTGTAHDTPYVPSPRAVVIEMLRLAGTGPQDIVYDLGSGDGRVVITAAKEFGARAVGVELDARLVAQSRAAAVRVGVADRVKFLEQDLLGTDLSAASVVALYLAPNLNLKLRPALLRLKPGTRIVAHGSDLGDWRPDRKTSIRKDVWLWIVPAQVAGRWRGSLGEGSAARSLEIELAQRFQELSGRAWLAGKPSQLWEARLEGERIGFVIVDALDTPEEAALYFEGRASGGMIEGSATRGAGRARSLLPWRVTK